MTRARPRCTWCGEPVSVGATSCAGCMDLERALLIYYGPPAADDAERELLELEAELRRQADDA